MQWFFDHIGWFGNGFDQTSILIALCVLDTSLGISLRLYNHQGLHSQRFLAGVIHNFFPAIIPSLLTLGEMATKHFIPIYSIVSLFLFLLIGYFLIQSILANATLLGLDVEWIKKWLDKEIQEKSGGK